MTIIPYQKYRLSLICVSGDDIFQLTALRDPDSSPPRYKSTINELSLVMLQIQIWIIIMTESHHMIESHHMMKSHHMPLLIEEIDF